MFVSRAGDQQTSVTVVKMVIVRCLKSNISAKKLNEANQLIDRLLP
jgi:hypothetical protein